MSNIKRKKLNKILPLFLAINSMSQGTFADSKIHNIKENKEVIDAAKEQKIESKKQETDKKEKQTDKPKISESEIKKQTRNYKKIGAISLLSASSIISPIYAGYYFGFPLYANYEFRESCPTISASWAKYMDMQPSGANNWCQFYAFQGILNKEFNIKCKVPDLYDIAFPGDSVRDEKKFMKDEKERKTFMDKIIDKYKISREPYIVVKDMNWKTKGADGHIDDVYQVKEALRKAYEKCGAICINTCFSYEHALLVTDIDEVDITIETNGMSFVCSLDLFVKCLVYNDKNLSHTPGDCKHDAKLRIYGFKKT